MRLQNFADGARRNRRIDACTAARPGIPAELRRNASAAAAGFGNSGFGCGAIAIAATRRRAAERLTAPAAFPARRTGRNANRAQVAFDHRQPIDHMAERVVNGFERILGVAAGFRLIEADVGQFALDDVDHAAVGGLGQRCGCSRPARQTFACWVSRWRRMSCSPSSTRPRLPAAVIGGRLQAFEQIGHALFEMGESGCAVVADRHAVEAVGQRPQRAFELLGAFACAAALAASSVEVKGGDALFENRKRIAVAARSGQAGRPWTTACGRRR